MWSLLRLAKRPMEVSDLLQACAHRCAHQILALESFLLILVILHLQRARYQECLPAGPELRASAAEPSEPLSFPIL